MPLASPVVSVLNKVLTAIGQVGIFCALSLFSSPVFAYEQCWYPIQQTKFSYWIKDVHGFTNVNAKETLRDAHPVVTCVLSGSSFPECSTPWKGLVYVKKVSGDNWYHIGGFRDKSDNVLVFSFSSGGSSYSPMQIHPSEGSKVAKCGSLVVNRWVQVIDKYDNDSYYFRANEFDVDRHSEGSRAWMHNGRRVVMREAKYVMYGTPTRMHEGITGNF